jgi:hypothetical protein
MRQGIREAGRQGSVANFGSNTTCSVAPGTTLPPTVSDNLRKLLCTAKDQVGVGNSVRLRIKFADDQLHMPAADPAYKRGNAIVVCAIYPLNSLTGLFQPFLNGHFARTKAAFRVEKTPTWTPAAPEGNPAVDNALDNPGNPPDGWGEPDPSGKNWDWCKTGS